MKQVNHPVLGFLLAVVQAGFAYAGPGRDAVLCPKDTYNPGLNRLSTCYSCPSGLITTSPGSNLKLDCCKDHAKGKRKLFVRDRVLRMTIL